MKKYYLYIIADKKHDNLTLDITDDLLKKMFEIKSSLLINDLGIVITMKLVYFEETRNILEAIRLKKKLKNGIKYGK